MKLLTSHDFVKLLIFLIFLFVSTCMSVHILSCDLAMIFHFVDCIRTAWYCPFCFLFLLIVVEVVSYSYLLCDANYYCFYFLLWFMCTTWTCHYWFFWNLLFLFILGFYHLLIILLPCKLVGSLMWFFYVPIFGTFCCFLLNVFNFSYVHLDVGKFVFSFVLWVVEH